MLVGRVEDVASQPQERDAFLAQFFQALADAFLKGDHVWLAGIYTHPLVIYIEGDIVVERTTEQTLENLFGRRETALRAGTKSIRSIIEDIGPENSGRFPVRVTWEFLSGDGRLLGTNELRYFCRFNAQGQPRIEILEFIKRVFSSLPSGPDGRVH